MAGVFHIINHATFKASLFMAAGIIDHEAGTRDMRRLNGLWNFMPYTATLAMVAAAAMAGVPLLNGFLSKEMFFAEAMHISAGHFGGWLLPALATLAGALAVAYSIRFIHDVFFNGEPVDLPRTPHEPPRWMKVPVEILVVLCLVVGIAPALTVAPLLAVAAASTLQAPLPDYHLALWHGFNPAAGHEPDRAGRRHADLPGAPPAVRLARARPRPARRAHRLQRAARRAVRAGALDHPHRSTPARCSARCSCSCWRRHWRWASRPGWRRGTPLAGNRAGLPLDAVSLPAGGALIVATLATVWLHRQRLVALITIGVVGLVVSLAFVKFSAPDLALTQLSVEVVTIVLLLLALLLPAAARRAASATAARALARRRDRPGRRRRHRRAGVGGADPALRHHRRLLTWTTACRAAAAPTW